MIKTSKFIRLDSEKIDSGRSEGWKIRSGGQDGQNLIGRESQADVSNTLVRRLCGAELMWMPQI